MIPEVAMHMDKRDAQIASPAWHGRTEADIVSLIDLLGKRGGTAWRSSAGVRTMPE